MTTCLVVRHGQSQANVDGILAGHLDSALTEVGAAQAGALAAELREAPIRLIVTSPLARCRSTADALAAHHRQIEPPEADDRVVEVRYGAWTGRRLSDLARDELWHQVQTIPSAVTFPSDDEHEHESLAEMSARAWEAWMDWDSRVTAAHGDGALWALVSHGDVIKALVARALGLPLDAFQSIVVDPSSVSVVHRVGERTAVSALNLRHDSFARLSRLDLPAPSGTAVVGGGDA